jgi:hypothetical protein
MAKYENEETLNQSIQTFAIGNWQIKALPHSIRLSYQERTQMEQMAAIWAKKFTQDHSNWMTEKFGVPSCIIRFDYVYKDGKIQVFEIEDRPNGLEVCALLNENSFNFFKDSLRQYALHAGKPLAICVSPSRMDNTDDLHWAKRINNCAIFTNNEMPNRPEDHLWFVRSSRTEREYYSLSPHALSTIEHEGDKSYGVGMKLWRELDDNGELSIKWNEPFVLKPASGCRCENLHMYHPKKPSGGFSTRSKIEQAILSREVRYLQDYHGPELPDFLPAGYSLIRRCFLTYDIISGSYRVIGGVWQSRPKSHKIHGASDSVSGSLVL